MSFIRLPLIVLPLVMGLALLTGACGAPLAVTGAGYAADGSLLAASDKTAADHFVSMISKKDCALWRPFRGQDICKEREGAKDPYNVDYAQPQRMVSEGGVQYAPPLRPAADAPATSWDAATYKSAPAPTAPAAPVTAVADAEPASAVAGPAPKPRKARSKKPSRDPAASVF